VDIDVSTHDQSLSVWIGERTSLFLSLDNSEYIVRQVCSKALDPEREWRDTPPLDRFSIHG